MARVFSLPSRPGNALKYLRVTSDEGNVEWDDITNEVNDLIQNYFDRILIDRDSADFLVDRRNGNILVKRS